MNLKGKKSSIWDKINYVEYFDVPNYPSKYNSIQGEKVFNESKEFYGMLSFVGLVGLIALLGKLIISFNEIQKNPIIYSIWGIISVALLIIGNKYSKGKKSPVLTLTNKGFKYKKTYYLWNSIKNMYVRKESNGDSENHYLMVEFKHGYEAVISLDFLDKNYTDIMKEISKYYWHAIQHQNTT
ncbi:MAG: hypothetical protein MI922_10550 [Bacteroidales bacterium]|nr:hypothetical protein [Bacteroidales bacterium]